MVKLILLTTGETVIPDEILLSSNSRKIYGFVIQGEMHLLHDDRISMVALNSYLEEVIEAVRHISFEQDITEIKNLLYYYIKEDFEYRSMEVEKIIQTIHKIKPIIDWNSDDEGNDILIANKQGS